MRQHSRSSDFLSVNLASVHVFQSFLGLLRGLVLHVSVTPGQVRMEPVDRHLNHFDFSVSGENLLNVVLGDISGQPS